MFNDVNVNNVVLLQRVVNGIYIYIYDYCEDMAT